LGDNGCERLYSKIIVVRSHYEAARGSHTNAPLSLGTLNGKVVTCPLHGAKFDIMTWLFARRALRICKWGVSVYVEIISSI